MTLFGLKIKQKHMVLFVGLAYFGLSFSFWFQKPYRYGFDYIAYVQQAGAVYNGETDYSRLSSHLGPCFYPAGHIWHYIPVYWLHLQTDHAESIMRLVHQIVCSLTAVLVTKISYLYLYSGKEEVAAGERTSISAQMVAIVCLTNMKEKEY